MISPPGVTDEELIFCNPLHINNMYKSSYYIEILNTWLATHPFANPSQPIPEDSVVELVYLALLQKLNPELDSNFIHVAYVAGNSNVYVMCNHSVACRLLMIGYEYDEDLANLEQELEAMRNVVDLEQ